MDVDSDWESDVVVTDVRPKQAALDIKLQVIKQYKSKGEFTCGKRFVHCQL